MAINAEELKMNAEEEQEEGVGSLLTDRQVRVLELRSKGCSQQEVADIMGTTRSNISIMEKRAHQNITRAKRTLLQWKMIQAPISVKIPAGADLFDLPSRIFDAADEKGIQLPVTSTDIIYQLRIKAPLISKKRAISREIEIFVTREGDVLLDDLD